MMSHDRYRDCDCDCDCDCDAHTEEEHWSIWNAIHIDQMDEDHIQHDIPLYWLALLIEVDEIAILPLPFNDDDGWLMID